MQKFNVSGIRDSIVPRGIKCNEFLIYSIKTSCNPYPNTMLSHNSLLPQALSVLQGTSQVSLLTVTREKYQLVDLENEL